MSNRSCTSGGYMNIEEDTLAEETAAVIVMLLSAGAVNLVVIITAV